jgi:hypothetical protein
MEGDPVLKWLLFFLLILGGILTFVLWVLGVPVPGLSPGPDSPFSP